MRARDDTKQVFDKIHQNAQKLGDDIGKEVNTRSSAAMQQEAQSGQAYARSGERIGDAIGRRISERVNVRVRESVNRSVDEGVRDSSGRARDARGRFVSGAGSGGTDEERVRVSVDVDKKGFMERIADLAEGAESRLRDGLQSGLSAVFSGDFISTLIKGGAIVALTAGLAPVLGGAIASAVLLALGGGFIAVGIAGALKSPRIKMAFESLKMQAGTVFADFGANFVGPLEKFMGGSGGRGGLAGVIEQIAPMVSTLGKTLGPIADKLGEGVIGLLQNLLPSIIRAADASAPIIDTLAGELPGIGDAIASIFDTIAAHQEDATQFFNDLLNLVQFLIRFIGGLIEVFLDMYTTARKVFTSLVGVILTAFQVILDGAAAAFGWVPGLGPKLTIAKKQFSRFREDVNKELARIPNKVVTITIRQVFTTVGQQVADVGRILAGRASGGIIGAASGGSRSGMTWVGEHGPELISAPAGSRVMSNPDSMRAAAAAGGGGTPMIVNLLLDGATLASVVIDPLRRTVQQRFGGNVQAALS